MNSSVELCTPRKEGIQPVQATTSVIVEMQISFGEVPLLQRGEGPGRQVRDDLNGSAFDRV